MSLRMLIREFRIEYDHVIDSRARADNYKVVGDHHLAKTLIFHSFLVIFA